MKSKVKIKKQPKKAIKVLEKQNKQLSGMKRVLVGLPKDTKAHKDEDGKGFTSTIDIGIVHEFGTSRIPERSFLRSTLIVGKRAYKPTIKKIMKKVSLGQLKSKQAMALLGEKMAGDVKAKITDIKKPPLKVRIGGNPLVDTGQLRSAITYVIRK